MTATLVIEQLDQELELFADLEAKLVQLAQRLKVHAPSVFWKEPRGLELRSVTYDQTDDEFVVAFRAGPEYRMGAGTLRLPASVTKASLDEVRHGVVVQLADGSETSFASDLVLYHSEPGYREAHEPKREGDQPDFGARIRALRLSAGLQAKDVAAAAGLAPSNYARLEASRHQPRVETLVRMAKALGVPLAKLVSERAD